MIENISTNKLKSDHAPERAPAQVILKVPHAGITYDKSALPSDVVFEISIHSSCSRSSVCCLMLRSNHVYHTLNTTIVTHIIPTPTHDIATQFIQKTTS